VNPGVLKGGDDALFSYRRRLQALESALEDRERRLDAAAAARCVAAEAREEPAGDSEDSSESEWDDDAASPRSDGSGAASAGPVPRPSSRSPPVVPAGVVQSDEAASDALLEDLVTMAAALKSEASALRSHLTDQNQVGG